MKNKLAARINRADLLTFLFIISISAVVAAGLYNIAIFKWTPQAAYQLFLSLIDHSAEAPMRYRILVPYFVQFIGSIIPGKPDNTFLFSYFLYYQFSVAFSLFLTYLFIRFWYPRKLAFTGVLIMSVSLLAAFGDGYFQPWSLLEIGLFAAGLICIYKDKETGLAVVVLLSSLNRETGIFLCIAYLLVHIDFQRPFIKPRNLLWTVFYFVIWGLVFGGLRIWLGNAPQLSIMEILQRNLTPSGIIMAVINISLFLGASWLLVFRGIKTCPEFIQKTWRVVPVYILFFLIFGLWQEVRLLSTLLPILITTALGQWDSL